MKRIAVVGAGISGMGAAYLLHKAGHTLSVYEKNARCGGHARTKLVEQGGARIAVDTGFIVFNYQNYPHLCGMFRHLGVPTKKSDMTFALSLNDGQIEWCAKNPNAVFGQRSNLLRPAFWGFVRDIFRFNRLALKTAEAHPQLTLGQLLDKLGMGQWYRQFFILPIGGAIWSCSLEQMLEFPALTFTRFFKAHGLLSVVGQPQWHTVAGGSVEYVKRLTAAFSAQIKTGCAAVKLRREGEEVIVTDEYGNEERFDEVVLACHGDEALALLSDATAEERQVLGAFGYSVNHAVLHNDTSIMPKRKRCWASWVYHAADDAPKDKVSITYWMNLLQGIDEDKPLFVTLNPLKPIAPEHVLDEHMFTHPIYTPQSIAAAEKLPLIQGKARVWFCGAHWRNGFHEDGLASGVAVAKALGAGVPWE